jgi:hypothetical protein
MGMGMEEAVEMGRKGLLIFKEWDKGHGVELIQG